MIKTSPLFKILLLALLLFNVELFAVSQTQIKAVFLEKFTHLIQWPDKLENEFLICVVNDKDFAKALKEIYKTKKFQDKKVKIINVNKKEALPNCQLLYLGGDIKESDAFFKQLKNKPMLTVSDQEDYISNDIMITIFLKQKRFKYVINNRAAKEVNIDISYLLLQSAIEVIQ